MAAGINDTFRQLGVAVGIAVWGAVFIARGKSEVTSALAGTPGAVGDRPRELVEATSSGNLDAVLSQAPAGSRDQIAQAANDAFLSGLNEILVLGAVLAFAGAVAALWLVREHEIDRAEPGVALPEEAEPAPA